MKKLLETLKQKWAEYLLEMIVITMGILGAFALNNWNENRIQEINTLNQLKVVHNQLTVDVQALRDKITEATELTDLMFRALEIIENETSLNSHKRLVLDSAFVRYKWGSSVFINTRSYEELLLTKSKSIKPDIYSKLNEYMNQFEEVSVRIRMFSETINQPEYDIELMASFSRTNSDDLVYSLEGIQKDKNLFESLRSAKTYLRVNAVQTTWVLEKALELNSEIRIVLDKNDL